MHHVPVTISADAARDLWRAYQKHRHYSTPIDKEVMSAYQKLAQGKLVIKALESVATGGVNERGLPLLAIARADAKVCRLTMHHDGGAVMSTGNGPSRRNALSTVRFEFPAETFPAASWRNAKSLVPHAPLHLRPKRGAAELPRPLRGDLGQGSAAGPVPAPPSRQGRSLARAGDVGPHRSREGGARRPAVKGDAMLSSARWISPFNDANDAAAFVEECKRRDRGRWKYNRRRRKRRPTSSPV